MRNNGFEQSSFSVKIQCICKRITHRQTVAFSCIPASHRISTMADIRHALLSDAGSLGFGKIIYISEVKMLLMGGMKLGEVGLCKAPVFLSLRLSFWIKKDRATNQTLAEMLHSSA